MVLSMAVGSDDALCVLVVVYSQKSLCAASVFSVAAWFAL
jgi:hypothetical protein